MARVIRRTIAGCLIAVIAFSFLKAFFTKSSAGSLNAGASFPARPEAYSLEMHSSNGWQSKEYVSGQLKRLENYDSRSDQRRLTIYRRDKGLSWTVEPGSKTVRETPFTPESDAMVQEISDLTRWREEGSDVIDGYRCRRFVGTYKPQATSLGFTVGPGGAYEESLIDSSNGLPVRHITYDRQGKAAVINERFAFSLDPPDSELFELPKGYDVERLEANR